MSLHVRGSVRCDAQLGGSGSGGTSRGTSIYKQQHRRLRASGGIRRNESVRHRRRSVLSSSVLSSVGVALAAISRDFTYIKQKQACVCMCFSVKRESLSTTSKFTAHVRKRHVLEVVREARELGAQHICIICIICMATIWPTNLETVMEKRHALGGGY